MKTVCTLIELLETPKAIYTTTKGWNKPNCDGYESRKKYVDGAWLNPKHLYNGQSAAKPQIEEGSTTIRLVFGVRK